MSKLISIDDIKIRTELKPGDIGYVIYRHGKLYSNEYNYGIEFENYVAKGLTEFYENYNVIMDKVWICEHEDKMIGFLLLMHRSNDTAQLRYFSIEPEYRGLGLGTKLMNLFMDFFNHCNYQKAYLWTTSELTTAAKLYEKAGFRLVEEKKSSTFGKPVIEQKYEYLSN